MPQRLVSATAQKGARRVAMARNGKGTGNFTSASGPLARTLRKDLAQRDAMFSLGDGRGRSMRVSGIHEGRFLGYVQVQVASRVYTLPVEAAPLGSDQEPARKAGFFADGTDRFGILVDSDAPDKVQRETIERASVDAAVHLSRRFLN
jgi:hypothetical protein